MSLNDFLRVNLPYGICQYKKGYWYAFNREYLPLGFSEKKYYKIGELESLIENHPYLTKYKGISESIISKIAADENSVSRNQDGSIDKIFLYNDASNPNSTSTNWTAYQKRLKILAKLSVNR